MKINEIILIHLTKTLPVSFVYIAAAFRDPWLASVYDLYKLLKSVRFGNIALSADSVDTQ